ncbi:hypothetical protein AAV94_10125 [Lampropedia cohaerens]|uniref:2-C-methyl-D-erythritol 4-phosphate cytidylyltransferase n=1 Tax=Lampropedia cohaerens TaxID=1610491 RepID=A0A0U1PYB2_9BURK|nr:2-C-methyl-D-erythritol 4-phosphate cytidylyltransferase [Lampropedia cohaerens]KKW67509.1 hypothetical protein AAV94_10125 [Lampropedia cohaerens]
MTAAAETDRPATARAWALVPAAGQGSRAGTGVQPKQYRRIAGHSLLEHTLHALVQVQALARVLVVVAPGDPLRAAHLPTSLPQRVTVQAVGGPTRAQSVRNGLAALQTLGAQAHDWVLVHDAARCLVTPALVERLIDRCRHDAVGGLLALPLADTLKQQRDAQPGSVDADARVAQTVSRQGKWLAQTPQMFRLGLLCEALAADLQDVTDEASAVERLGYHPLLVPSSAQNFKVTYPEDFALAEAILRARSEVATS